MEEKEQKSYKLFIDELGTASPKHLDSELYILSGCSVDDSERSKIKTWSDQIKFKYWGRTDVVFHSREIWRRENDFSLLKDKKIRGEFLDDLEKFLLCSKFKLFFVVVDKNIAKKKAWNDVKIYNETCRWLIRNFLLVLLTNDSKGKIIVESATGEKDFYFHKALSYYLSGGIPEINVSHEKVKEVLTAISFVTKNNHDIEEQIADLFAYIAKCKYFQKRKKKFESGDYEERMLKLINKKLFKIPKDAKKSKMKFFEEVKPFLILP
ncbi:MAG: DUF3800 domain-containing protein [Candidatus Moranbacteria bacterium]|nr:DUF3800 domain-containing protein [Candidatus Moranbacteria bacterium]